MTPRLVLILGLAAAAGFAQTPAQESQTFGAGAVRLGDGITPPSVVKQVQPRYTDDARNRGVEGEVQIEVVVKADGTVGDVRVTKKLDPGLDAEAMTAARQWLFKPGKDRDGNAIPVIVTIMLSFRTGTATDFAAADFAKGACRAGVSGTTEPKLLSDVEPKYTSDAMRAKIAGTVTVEAVVGPDGKVMRSRVSKSLDPVHGLDHEALKAMNQWTFEKGSGKCQGVPAPVLVTYDLQFRLH
ncbi:MAG TPA: energy transducer TonB [Vicinamibacterales bacterium]|nr:energy transducer TonB [Vicinamibacterales bacterium]